MFCDLVGSTDLSGRLDPEDLREVVRAYQETATTVIQQFTGHIAQYLGDGLLVYFGYPRAHGDEARRAVHTGLGIVAALDTLNHQLQTKYGVQLAVRLGIHTGSVVVGQMGGDGHYEHLALGETPNIAARLEGLAPPNTVVISPVTARLAADTFILETMGPQELKGVPALWRCGVSAACATRTRSAWKASHQRTMPCCWWDGTRNSVCCGGAGRKARRGWGR
jgi:class 3 adenylate cyclase